MLLRALCLLMTLTYVYGQDENEQEIAFSVGLSNHAALDGGDVVVYDRVFSNVGSAYSSSTGKFVCPRSGIYAFQVHALSRTDADMWLEMRHNYMYIMSIWGHTDNQYASGGNSVILQLTKGDEVYVESVVGYHSDLYGRPDEVYSTFSGYLITGVYDEFTGVVG